MLLGATNLDLDGDGVPDLDSVPLDGTWLGVTLDTADGPVEFSRELLTASTFDADLTGRVDFVRSFNVTTVEDEKLSGENFVANSIDSTWLPRSGLLAKDFDPEITSAVGAKLTDASLQYFDSGLNTCQWEILFNRVMWDFAPDTNGDGTPERFRCAQSDADCSGSRLGELIVPVSGIYLVELQISWPDRGPSDPGYFAGLYHGLYGGEIGGQVSVVDSSQSVSMQQFLSAGSVIDSHVDGGVYQSSPSECVKPDTTLDAKLGVVLLKRTSIDQLESIAPMTLPMGTTTPALSPVPTGS